ncbi:MAG TPA: hypothetical protein VFO58_00670 [Vicinamibacterales bacterium]|nr:hypothetical protein [Vicinamibacterales bacterium]
MAPTGRWTYTAMTAVVLLMCGVTVTRTHPPMTRTAGSDESQGSRVRILSPQMAHAVRDGISRSPTFRRLVDAIDASDGIVYVEYGVCRNGARGCLLGSLRVAGPSRILRVLIQKTQLEDELVVSLGHELQHAVEVLSEPSVTTSAEMMWLFETIGIRSGDSFETSEAVRVSDEIHRELAATARRGGGTRVVDACAEVRDDSNY